MVGFVYLETPRVLMAQSGLAGLARFNIFPLVVVTYFLFFTLLRYLGRGAPFVLYLGGG
jgi:hypothetical protein